MSETLHEHRVMDSNKAAAQVAKIDSGDATSASVGVLYKNEQLNQPQESLGEIASGLKIGKEREKKYHSIASKVYSVVSKMNADKNYFFKDADAKSMDEKQQLLEVRQSIPDLKDEEDSILAENIAQIPLTDEDRDAKVASFTEEARQRKLKHDVLGRYIDKILEESDKRASGQDGAIAPTVKEVAKQANTEAFDRREYVNTGVEKDFPGMGYAELQGYASVFTPDSVTLLESSLPTDATGFDGILTKIQSLQLKIKSELPLITSKDKREVLETYVTPALEKMNAAVLERRRGLGERKDREGYLEWVNQLRSKSPYKDLENVIATASRVTDFTASAEKYTDLELKISQLKQSTEQELNSPQIPSTKRQEAETHLTTTYIRKAESALTALESKTLDFWERNALQSKHAETGSLKSALQEFSKARSTSSESMNLYRRIKENSEKVTINKDSYKNDLPQSLRVKGDQHVTGVIAEANGRLPGLLTEAFGFMKSEVAGLSEVKGLRGAILDGSSPKSTIPDVQKQEQEINEALKNVNVAALVGSFAVELQADAEKEIRQVVESARPVLDVLAEKKTGLEKAEKTKNAEITRKLIVDVMGEVNKTDFSEAKMSTLSFSDAAGLKFKFTSLEQMKTRLTDEFAEYQKNYGSEGDTAVLAKQYEDAKAKLDRLIFEKKEALQETRESIWYEILDRPNSTAQDFSDAQTRIMKSCDLLPAGEAAKEKKYWQETFKMLKAYGEGSKGDPGARRRLAWKDAKGSRERIAPLAKDGIDTKFFREYYHAPENYRQRAVVDKIKEIYANGYAYTDGSGATKVWSFAQNGEPPESSVKSGAKSLDKVLRESFGDTKEFPNSLIDTAIYFSIDIELRMPYLANWYRNYLVSPDFDVSPITDVDPEAAAYYSIRKAGSVEPSMLYWLKILAAPTGPTTENNEVINPHSFKYKDIGSRQKKIGNEYQPKPAPKKTGKNEFEKNDPNTAIQNEAIEEAYELAVMTDISLTSAYQEAFTPVRRRSGKRNLIPYYSEGILSDETYGIEYDKNPENLDAWIGFVKFVQNPPSLTKEYGPRSALVDAANTLSKAKQIFKYLDDTKDERRLKDFTDAVTQMLLRYTKNIFNQFYTITQGDSPMLAVKNAWEGREITKSGQFIKEALETFEGLKTLPGDLSEDLQNELKRLQSNGKGELIFGATGFFSLNTNDPTIVVGAGPFGDRKEHNSRVEKLALFKQKAEEKVAAKPEKGH